VISSFTGLGYSVFLFAGSWAKLSADFGRGEVILICALVCHIEAPHNRGATGARVCSSLTPGGPAQLPIRMERACLRSA
jgi:hypothetical protein